MSPEFVEKNELQAKRIWTLWNPIINVRDEQRDRSHRDAGRTRFALAQEPVMKYLESDGSL